MKLHPSYVSSSYVIKVMACERNKFNDRVKLHPWSDSSFYVIKVKTWERNKFNDRYDSGLQQLPHVKSPKSN